MLGALSTLKSIGSVTVVVVGDVMLDRYAWGTSTRQSPEAPVPVVDIEREEARPGGAANVAANLAAMGAKVRLVGVVGADADGQELIGLLQKSGVDTSAIEILAGRMTTVKTRIITPKGHMMRLDREQRDPWQPQNAMDFSGADVLILQDYNKGVLNAPTIAAAMAAAESAQIPVAVDPKFDNFHTYAGATLFKPNLKELQAAFGKELDPQNDEFEVHLQSICQQLEVKHLMVTMSEQGVALTNGVEVQRYPADFNSIVDVSGAGDTVMSVAALGLVLGWSMADLARVSSYCGGWTCQFKGVVAPDIQKILETLSH